MAPLCEADGQDGTVVLYEGRIEIERSGMFASFMHFGEGAKTIPIENVSSVEYREPGRLAPGYIAFLPHGEDGLEDVFDWDSSPYAVAFNRNDAGAFEELREWFREIRDQRDGGNDGSSEDPLTVLERRYANGEIDDEEFARKRDVLRSE